MQDNRPIIEVCGVRLLNVPHAAALAEECIANDCYRIRELDGKWNVLDIGACYGEFGLYAAKLGHNVVMVEPSSISYAVLRANAECCVEIGDKRAATFHAAVGYRRDIVSDHFYRKDHPAGSGKCESLGVREKVTQVQVGNMLDYFLFEPECKNLLKLDCEGAEVEIFDHIDEWVDRVHAVSMETHNHDADVLGAMLATRGFKVELFGTCPQPPPPWDKSMKSGLVIARR